MKIGEKIKELRQEINKSQYEISKEIGVARYTYANWEQERSEPSIDDLAKLANFFNCSIDYLVGREDEFGNLQQDNSSEPLSSDEQRLLRSFRLLGNVERRALLTTAESLSAQAGQSIRKTN